MRISMPRGDIKWLRFMVNAPNGTASDIDFTNIYFTVKRRTNERSYFFQKSLKRGEIYKLGLGDYQLKIEPKDTNKLALGDYKFDIQISYRNLLKETFVGDFVVKEEVTYDENEDYEESETDFSLPQTSSSSAVILTVPDYHVVQLETPIDIVETTNYNELSNIPQINGVPLTGNITLEELGVPVIYSDQENIEINFIDNLVDDDQNQEEEQDNAERDFTDNFVNENDTQEEPENENDNLDL